MTTDRHGRPHPLAQWLHLVLLLAVVSALQIGRLLTGAEHAFTLSVFVRSMYGSLPALAGIAISIRGIHSKGSRDAVLLGSAVISLMVLLDLYGSLGLGIGVNQASALYPDASVMTRASQTAVVSWVRTAVAWLGGDLGNVGEARLIYPFDDPRLRAAHAIAGAGLVLLVFASIGFVTAAMSWTRAHVVFKQGSEERTFNIVIAWLLAPLVVELSNRLAADQRFRALFRGAALWRPLVPHVLVFLVGIFLWWYAARYREPEDS